MSRAQRVPDAALWTAGIALISVIYMVLVVPISFGSDETQHIFRAYQLSLGTVLPEIVHCLGHHQPVPCRVHYGGHLVPHRRAGGPVSVALQLVLQTIYQGAERGKAADHFNPHVYARVLGVTFATSRTSFAHFENTALYSPANYLPEMLVFWVGRVFAEPVIATLFAARLAAGLVWATLVTASVAIVPRWKWLFALALLVPTAMAQGSSVSADSMAFAVTGFMIAFALWLADRGGPPHKRELACMSALGLLVGLLKTPLPLVVFAAIVIVWPVLGTGRARAWRVAAIALPASFAAVWWTIASSAFFVPYRNTVFRPISQVYISPSQQAHYLLTHFYDVPALLWQTLIHGQLLPISELVGAIGETSLSKWFALGWLAVFFVLVLGSDEGAKPARRLRAWLAGTLVAFLLATALVIYLSWTGVGAGVINGIHGRYFTPVIALLIPVLAGLGGRRLRISERTVAWTAIVVLIVCTATTFVHTSYDYYHQMPWQALPRVTSALF